MTPNRFPGSCGPVAMAMAEMEARKLGFTFDELRAQDRRERTAWARHAVIHALYMTGRYSLPAIGRLFERDHTSILNSVQRYSAALALADGSKIPTPRAARTGRGFTNVAPVCAAVQAHVLAQFFAMGGARP